MFIGPGTPVYTGMVVGANTRPGDIGVNVCRKKHVTNTRNSAAAEDSLRLVSVRPLTLEECLEFIDTDEVVEVTPKSLRMRKRVLDHDMRLKLTARKKSVANPLAAHARKETLWHNRPTFNCPWNTSASPFSGKPALQDLSFEIRAGEIFGFLGPSGAGKTTTIKLLTRQLRADAGSIRLFDQDITSVSNQAFDRIGVLSDNSGLYERLSVYENLAVFADLKRVPRSAILPALEQVGLAGEAKKSAKALSRGMKQRLMLVRAVLHKPDLLFLDEPTASLDPATVQQIHGMLRALNAQGTTLFLTTHNMEEADRLCSRVAFLNHGVIVACDRPSTLKMTHAQNKLVATTASGATYQVEKSKAGLAMLLDSLGEDRLLDLAFPGAGSGIHLPGLDGEGSVMNIQAYKVAALFRKDWKDTLKNGNFLLLCILPLGLSALYTFIDFGGFRMEPLFVLSIGLLMNLSLLPLSATSMMIAEEKEKYTLRTLMLSNVSATEFLLSKALVVFLLMQIVNLAV